jgi:hypothetical protein
VHEVGMMQKQSGAWAQHLTAATHLEGNILLNGPHAALDFNDGFGEIGLIYYFAPACPTF